MNEKKRLLKNTGFIAIGNLGAKVISFLLLPLYTSILSTEAYGTYDFIVAANAFLFPVVSVCMHEALFRFIIERGETPKEFARIVSNAFVVIVTGLVVLTGGVMLVNYIHPFDYWHVFLAYMIANTLYVYAVSLLRGMGRMKEYAVISGSRNVLQVVLNVVAVVVLRWGVKGLVFSTFVTEILSFIVISYRCQLWKRIRLKYISKKTLREMFVYACPLIPNSVGVQVINISDRMIITSTIGTSLNGIYSISYKFPNIIETIYHYFYMAWSESASRVFEKEKEEAEKYYQSLYRDIDNMMFSVILFLTASMPIMFRIFVRGDYVQGFAYVPMLMFAMYFDCIAKFFSGIFTAYKKTKIMAWSTIIAAIVNIVVNIALIMHIGLYAAALSTLVAEITLVLIRKSYLSKIINLKISVKKVVLEVIVTLIVVGLYSYDDWMKIILSVIIAGGYSVVVNKNVIKSLMTKIKRKISKK